MTIAGFDELQHISRLLLTEVDDQPARELFIRFLDRFSGGGPLAAAVDSLAVRLGLFPYVSPNPEDISEAEALSLAYHSPASLSSRQFAFHAEQQKVYERLMDGESVVLSAPTSFGKSAIIDALVLSGKWNNFVLIVPTIALIDETRRRIAALNSDYVIVSHPSQTTSARNIFVLTQERFLELEAVPPVDFFVIDEFYKLGAGETDDKRRATLNIAWRRLRNTGAQYYLLGPNIDAVFAGEENELSRSLTISTFSPVVIDVEDRSEVDDRLADMKKFLASEADGPSLIFVSAPSRAGQVALELADAKPDRFVGLLSDWVSRNYDSEWYVAKALAGGVGVHTGPMPRGLQRAMIRLFGTGAIDRLVCTTTLIEGVNTVARNVVIYDKKIDRKPIDFFTFSNIRGRAGRMLKHFVGRVISYADLPPAEEATLDVPIESQSPAASLATLVQLDPGELSADSANRLSGVLDQTDLSVATIRKNRALDPELQIAAARRMRRLSARQFAELSWTGAPTAVQLNAAIELGYEELLRGRDRSGENPQSIAGKLAAVRNAGGDVPRLVQAQMRYQKPGQSRSDVVDEVLSFQRNWMGFKIPSVLRSISAIQGEVAHDRGAQSANYEYALRQIEALYAPPYIAELEDYGLPMPLGLRLSSLGLRGDSLEDVVSNLLVMAGDDRIIGQLDEVEWWFLEDVVSGLVGEIRPMLRQRRRGSTD